MKKVAVECSFVFVFVLIYINLYSALIRTLYRTANKEIAKTVEQAIGESDSPLVYLGAGIAMVRERRARRAMDNGWGLIKQNAVGGWLCNSRVRQETKRQRVGRVTHAHMVL